MVNQYCAHSLTRNWQLPFLNQGKGENDRRKYFMINHHERMLLTQQGSNPQRPNHQSDTHPTKPPRPASRKMWVFLLKLKLSLWFIQSQDIYTYHVQMSIFHSGVKSSIFYKFQNENFDFKIYCWKHFFSGFILRNNQQYFNIFCGFAHRLGQSLHIWKIALSDP